jgi:hypothetical protein
MKPNMQRTGVALDSDRFQGGEQIFDLWAKELRRRAQGVPVLAKLALVFFNSHLFFVSMS